MGGVRQVSVGTIWTVGGLAPASTGIPTGRGGLLGSGTNAPLYTTSFSAVRPKAKEDLENHEARLALALDFDRAGRIFEFRESPSPQRHPREDYGKEPLPEQKSTWTGTEWVMGGPDRSKS